MTIEVGMKSLTVSDWGSMGALVVAAAALLVSFLAWRTAVRGQRLAEKQEARRAPKLEVRLLEAFSKSLRSRGRLYAFKLLITNPSDTDNAVSSFELAVRHRRDLPMTLRVPAIPGEVVGEEASFVAPLKIEAHQTQAGWCYFLAGPKLLAGVTIDGYEIIATDTHMVPVGVESLVIFERVK